MTIEQREQTFKEQVFRMIAFPSDILQEFYEYWTEPSKSGTKLKFEMEKTWDLNRRLRRWQLMGDSRKDFYGKKTIVHTSVKPVGPAPITEVEKLDSFLQKYIDRPTEIPFSDFLPWYDYMKAERLLRPLTGQEIANLKAWYKDDNNKCRCACVQMTLDGYVRGGFTFQRVMEVRMKLV